MSFEANFDLLRKRTTGADFESALQRVLKAAAMVKFPTFVQGTLPHQYATSLAVPVKKMKKATGNAMWLKDFASNRARHNRMYGHESVDSATAGDDDGADEVAVLLERQERLARTLRGAKKRRRSQPTPRQRASTARVSPKVLPPSRVAPPPVARSPSVPNMIVNNDDVIVVDDDDDEDDENDENDEEAGNVEVSVSRRRKRPRRVTRSTTPTRTRPHRLILSSGGEDDDVEEEEETEADARDVGGVLDDKRQRVTRRARGDRPRKSVAFAVTRAKRLDFSSSEDDDDDHEGDAQDDEVEEPDRGFSPDADGAGERDDGEEEDLMESIRVSSPAFSPLGEAQSTTLFGVDERLCVLMSVSAMQIR